MKSKGDSLQKNEDAVGRQGKMCEGLFGRHLETLRCEGANKGDIDLESSNRRATQQNVAIQEGDEVN